VSSAGRFLTRLLLGLAVVGVVAGGTGWLLRRDSGSGSRATGGPDATSPPPATVGPTAPPTTTTTALPGLALPLGPPPARITWAGDSVAFTLHDAISASASERGVQAVDRTTPGCGMVRGEAADDNLVPIPFVAGCDGYVPANLAATAGAGGDVITWLSSWETSNRVVDGAGYVFGTAEGDAETLALVDESVQRLTVNGARVVFLLDPPATTGPLRPQIDPVAQQRMLHLGDLLKRYAAAHPDRTGVIDLAPIVCPGGTPCPPVVAGITLRAEDGGHFTPEGAAWLAPQILDRLVGRS
jgi:hypothetical protein